MLLSELFHLLKLQNKASQVLKSTINAQAKQQDMISKCYLEIKIGKISKLPLGPEI